MRRPREELNPLHLTLAVLAAAAAAVALPAAPPSIAAPAVNVTAIIEGAGNFETLVSLLVATKVGDMFQDRANAAATAGITIFAPTDVAFSVASSEISKLTATEKVTVLEYHALSAFYPLSALQQATDPVTPTLATDAAGAGKFTVNVTNVDGTVYISTRRSRAALISTLYNTVPCSVFAIDHVLLPSEIFGPLPAPEPAPAPAAGAPGPSAPARGSSPVSSTTTTTVVSSIPASPFGAQPRLGAATPPLSPSPPSSGSAAAAASSSSAVFLCFALLNAAAILAAAAAAAV